MTVTFIYFVIFVDNQLDCIIGTAVVRSCLLNKGILLVESCFASYSVGYLVHKHSYDHKRDGLASLNLKKPIQSLRQRFCYFSTDYIYVSNGVTQGRTLSSKLYYVYVDDLPEYLARSPVECHIDNLCVSHVMYTDDI